MKSITETAESIAAHPHKPFKGHSEKWYSAWSGKCPTCDHVPTFEEVEIEPLPPRGMRVFLTSGERVNK